MERKREVRREDMSEAGIWAHIFDTHTIEGQPPDLVDDDLALWGEVVALAESLRWPRPIFVRVDRHERGRCQGYVVSKDAPETKHCDAFGENLSALLADLRGRINAAVNGWS